MAHELIAWLLVARFTKKNSAVIKTVSLNFLLIFKKSGFLLLRHTSTTGTKQMCGSLPMSLTNHITQSILLCSLYQLHFWNNHKCKMVRLCNRSTILNVALSNVGYCILYLVFKFLYTGCLIRITANKAEVKGWVKHLNVVGRQLVIV